MTLPTHWRKKHLGSTAENVDPPLSPC